MNSKNALILKKILQEKPKSGKIIKTCLAGSHAYGLQTKGSDLDVRGIFMLPNSAFYGINEVEEEWEPKGYDAKWYEIGKFFRLSVNGNPNILEILFMSPVFHTKEYQAIYDNKHLLLASKPIVSAHRGFANSEMKAVAKLEDGAKKNKRMSHVVRLLVQCEYLLRYGYTPVKLHESALDKIMEIKTGKMTYEQVCNIYGNLLIRLTKAEEHSCLQHAVDLKKVNDLLISIRRM